MTDWMISIQKMMRTTLSLRVSDFTMTTEMPKATAAPSTTKMAGLGRAYAGAHDDDNADQPEHDRRDAGAAQFFAEEDDSQERRPDRRRELDRDEFAERDQRQRIEPRGLAGIVGGVAADMLQRPSGPHRRKTARHEHQRQEDEEADHRAQFHDLEHVEAGCRFAAGYRHDQERGDGPRHPQGGLEVRLLGDHGALCRKRRPRPQRLTRHSTGPALRARLARVFSAATVTWSRLGSGPCPRLIKRCGRLTWPGNLLPPAHLSIHDADVKSSQGDGPSPPQPKTQGGDDVLLHQGSHRGRCHVFRRFGRPRRRSSFSQARSTETGAAKVSSRCEPIRRRSTSPANSIRMRQKTRSRSTATVVEC